MTKGRSNLIDKQIAATRRSLKTLDRSLRQLSKVITTGAEGAGRRRSRLSAKARASLVLQGRYMGYMRQLRPRQKAHVRKIRERKGVREAIQRARKLATA